MTLIQELKGFGGRIINGVQFNIDIVSSCCLACPSCGVGSIGGQHGKPMTIETFRRILNKAQSEVKVKRVQMYMYTDALLHKDCHLFVQELTDRGIESTMSTMCQTHKADVLKVIEARPTEFRISFPGWDKMPYYQKGAKPEVFDKNFKTFASLPRYPETKWNLIFHLYNDNKDEIPRARKLAEDNGMHFVILPAIMMVLEKYVEQDYSDQDKELMGHLLETPEEAAKTMKLSPDYCILWKQISIDADGMVRLCQLTFRNEFKLVSYLDYPIEQIRSMIRNHSFCGKCMKMGGNVLQECYSDMVKYDDPIKEADKKRRLTGVNEKLREL